MRLSVITSCVLLTALCTGTCQHAFGSDSDAAPTMSSLNGSASAPAAPAAPAPAETSATSPASDPGPTSGGPIAHAVVPPVSTPVTGSEKKAGKQGNKSRIGRAIKALDAAIEELNKAPDDFGGHKADAIKSCETARDQLKAAVAYREEHAADAVAPKP
jgi:hypothetical protein